MHAGVDNIVKYKNESIGDLKSVIKINNYDLIFDLHKNFRSVFSTLFTKPEIRTETASLPTASAKFFPLRVMA